MFFFCDGWNPEGMDGGDAGFACKFTYEKSMQTRHQKDEVSTKAKAVFSVLV